VGSLNTNQIGRTLLSVIETHDFVVLNACVPPHYSHGGQYEWSILDLSIVSADIASRCDATVFNEFIGSDHVIVQIGIRGSDPPTKTHVPRWNFRRQTVFKHFLNKLFEQVATWCINSGFRLSPPKSAAVLFTRKRKPPALRLVLTNITIH